MDFPGESELGEVCQKILRNGGGCLKSKVLFASNGKIFYTQGETIYHKGTGMGAHRTRGGFGPVPWEQSWDLTSQQNVACLLAEPHGLHVSHCPLCSVTC